MKYGYVFLFLLLTFYTNGQVRQTLPLTAPQQGQLGRLIQTAPEVRALWQSVEKEAKQHLSDEPSPLRVIHYEGLLDTNPDRVLTTQSLKDLDKVDVWLSAWYGSQDKAYAEKIRTYMLAWADAYIPTGNPINENKLEPLIHSYQVLKNSFSKDEKQRVDQWLTQLAEAEMAFPRIPENNWKAKHIKLVGTLGLILQKPAYVAYAREQFNKYISNALYADGTSRDLHQRDALSYHVSGLEPLLTLAITMDQLGRNKNGLQTFNYQNPAGGSLRKSVDYVVPYAMGEKVHAEWVNTKVELDRQRAAAGIAHYQPGTPYEPEKSREMFALGSYFDSKYEKVLRHLSTTGGKEFSSWFSVLVAAARE